MNPRSGRWKTLGAGILAAVAMAAQAVAADTTPAAQLQRWQQAAGANGDAVRGEQLFTRRGGNDLACSSCHHARPVVPGEHVSTGKAIDALAPAVNADAFTQERRADKWFRRNCRDVLARECTPQEKADILVWLIGLR
ncbi:MAG: DUF1924 domain-containing protein [Burkholderiaceae bacterium]